MNPLSSSVGVGSLATASRSRPLATRDGLDPGRLAGLRAGSRVSDVSSTRAIRVHLILEARVKPRSSFGLVSWSRSPAAPPSASEVELETRPEQVARRLGLSLG